MYIQEIIDFEINNLLIELRTKFDLRKFKQIEGIKNKIIYANTHLNKDIKYLGHGSARIAFLLSNRFVLKIARPNRIEKGIAQNEAEVEIYNKTKSDLITKVYDFDPTYEWIISELVREISGDDDLKSLTNINLKQFFKILSDISYKRPTTVDEMVLYYDSEIDKLKNKLNKEIDNSKIIENKIVDMENLLKITLQNKHFYMDLLSLINDNAIIVDDLGRLNHWGKTTEQRLVILDYGFTKNVGHKHY